MSTVRPPHLTPPQPSAARPAEPPRLAAQRAFFDLAAGKTQSAAAPAAPVAAAPRPAAPAERRPKPAAEPPGRSLRPGSLLDIRV